MLRISVLLNQLINNRKNHGFSYERFFNDLFLINYMRTEQVLTIIYRRNKGKYEFLLLKRTPEKGGFWQPPSGGVESDDESILEAAYREVYEETSISKKDVIHVFENIHSFIIEKHYITGETQPPIKEHVYAFEVNPQATVSLDGNVYIEHTEYKWVSYEEAMKMLKWDNNKEGFEKLYLLINK